MSGRKSYSQSGEDIIIDFLFKHVLSIDPIRYLDVGANDPIKFNNTYLFYEEGHRGICVDPNPYFKASYKGLRPDDIFISAGVGGKETKEKFYIIEPHTLSTFSKKEAEKNSKQPGYKLEKIVKLPIVTIDRILSKYNSGDLPNLFSLDVEGLDFEILKSIDFNRWSPAVICVETLTYTSDAKEQKINEVIEYLEGKGYRVYADTYINTVFVGEEAWSSRN